MKPRSDSKFRDAVCFQKKKKNSPGLKMIANAHFAFLLRNASNSVCILHVVIKSLCSILTDD